MDKKKPLSRQKRITESKGSVSKRGDALNLGGPVGKADGYAEKTSVDTTSSAGTRAGTAKAKPGLLIIVVLAIAAVAVFMLLGDGPNRSGSDGELLETLSSDPFPTDTDLQGDEYRASGDTDLINRNVSSMARPKLTKLIGDGKDTVTIMVYMCGTDLEVRGGAATTDLQEMLQASISDNVNVIIETGGTPQWKNNIVDGSTNQRYKLTEGKLQLLEGNLGKKSMVEASTLSDFIKFCTKNYPANRNMLIFWDHGGGSVSGFGYDMHFKGASMTLDQIATALKDGGCTFDIIGFDACLMATLETAIAMEPYADYLLASEETEPGGGWYYTNWLSEWSKNTSMSTVDIGKKIIDDFIDYTKQGLTTLSIIDLAEVKGVIPEKLASFSESTAKMIQQGEYQNIAKARGKVREFATSSKIDHVDLIHLARGIGTSESIAFADALAGCVKYNRTCSSITNAYGISAYFPYASASKLDSALTIYDKIGMEEEYGECIKSFANLQLGGQISTGGTPLDSLFGNLLGGGASALGGAITPDMIGKLLSTFLQSGDFGGLSGLIGNIAPSWLNSSLINSSAKFYADNRLDPSTLVFTEKDGQMVLQLEQEQWNLVQTVELNVFLDDGNGFIDLGLDNVFSFNDDGDLIAEYDDTWLAINGQAVSYYLLSVYEDGDSYLIQGRVPAMLNNQLVDLILEYTDENPYGEVAGARIHYLTETDTEAKGLIEIQQGDKIDFLCDYYTYDRQFQDNYYLGEQLTVDGPLTISNIDIGSDKAIAGFRLTDIYNNSFWTPEL